MRTFLKIFVTAVVLAGAFVAYLVLQPASAMRSVATSRPAAQALKHSEGNLLVGEGENAWVRQFDEVGRLASRFRAEKWEPEKSGLVRVTRPEAELYLKGGKDKDGKDKPRPRVTIRGTDGEVVLQGMPDASSADKPLSPMQGNLAPGGGGSIGPTQPPSSGRLNDVVIDVFENETATKPVATLRTNNIVFDNETFRISTESYTAEDGTTVAPDEVPVKVEGPYFDFYGRGMTVRWNDLEERLDLLRIAHGERLVIKKVDAFSGAGGFPTGISGNAQPAAASPSAMLAPPLWTALVSADPAAAFALASADKARADKRPKRGAAAAQNATTRPVRRRAKAGDRDKEEPTYHAVFEDDVRILQGEAQLATARVMNVDFLLGQRKANPATTRPTSQPTSQPASQPTSRPASQPTTAASEHPEQADAATQPSADTQPTTVATAEPATQPVNEPVTVFWTGELNVTPLGVAGPTTTTAPSTAATTAPATASLPGDGPVPPGEARVELVGAPAVLTRDLLEVRTARFVYRTDGRLWLDKSDEFPRVLITQRSTREGGLPTTVSTEGLTYARAEQLATLRGDSRVLAPVDTGDSRADAGGEGAKAGPDMLDASWKDSAAFRLVGQTEQDMWVQHAQFAGDVHVKAPQGNVRARQLELAFDPPTPAARRDDDARANADADADAPAAPAQAPKSSQPNLRHVLATDNVFCELIDAKEGRRLVECQRLALDTARSDAGELYTKIIDAGGGVHAATADQELNASHVLLHLRPAKKQPTTPDSDARADAGAHVVPIGAPDPARAAQAAVELESMTATDAVRVASKDGGVATGKRLDVNVDEDGQTHVVLSGDPAQVQDAKKGTLTGPRILVDPKTGVAHIPGPGTLRAVQRDEKDDPADASKGRPIEVTWADSADVRGGEDRIEISGAVSLWLTDTDGSVRTANAGRVVIELAAKPADEQDTVPQAAKREGDGADERAPRRAGATGAASDPIANSMNVDLFKDKEVSKVHLHDNAVINSRLTAADGSVLRQFHLKAGTITYDVRGRHLTVPVPGQMLVESHDAPGAAPKQAGADDAAGKDPAMLATGSGATAFEWHKSMEYDEADGRAVMDGSVVVSHQPDAKGAKPQPGVRLDADRLVAVFEVQRDAQRDGKGDAQGEARHANAQAVPGGDASKMQLRSVQADGNILIVREGSELRAFRIDYDPESEWVIARGTGRAPATFTDPSGAGTVRAGELWLNTRTWGVKVKDVSTRVGGPKR